MEYLNNNNTILERNTYSSIFGFYCPPTLLPLDSIADSHSHLMYHSSIQNTYNKNRAAPYIHMVPIFFPPSAFNLHLGCNDCLKCPLSGWILIDATPTTCTHLTLLAHNLFPFQNQSVGHLYSSHMLEHLSYDGPVCEVCRALVEWRRVLQTGGVRSIYLSYYNHYPTYCIIQYNRTLLISVTAMIIIIITIA